MEYARSAPGAPSSTLVVAGSTDQPDPSRVSVPSKPASAWLRTRIDTVRSSVDPRGQAMRSGSTITEAAGTTSSGFVNSPCVGLTP